MHSLGQFITINLGAIPNGFIHRPGLQRLPRVLRFIERRVEHGAVSVQLRIERAGRGMRKPGGNEIARHAIDLLPLLAHARGRERFEFTKGHLHRRLVCGNQSFVVQCHCQN